MLHWHKLDGYFDVFIDLQRIIANGFSLLKALRRRKRATA